VVNTKTTRYNSRTPFESSTVLSFEGPQASVPRGSASHLFEDIKLSKIFDKYIEKIPKDPLNMDENSGDLSDELDDFEASIDESQHKPNKNQTTYSNKPYDEAFEISQDLSMAESYDGRKEVSS
jgi:hypothetical protein